MIHNSPLVAAATLGTDWLKRLSPTILTKATPGEATARAEPRQR